MTNGLTDNKASVPDWVRSLIVFLHGFVVMDIIDLAGGVHDMHLADGLDQKKANRFMIAELAGQVLVPAYLTLLLWLALWIYRILPDAIGDLYWSVV
jgi:hypothetical protein